MQKTIHPAYIEAATVICACGHRFTVGSTVKELHVELCSQCHPFYTGKQKLVDTARRVEKFTTRAGQQGAESENRHGKKAKKVKLARIKKEKKAKAEKEDATT